MASFFSGSIWNAKPSFVSEICKSFSAPFFGWYNLKLGAFRLTPLCSIVPSFFMTSFPLLLFHVAVTEGDTHRRAAGKGEFRAILALIIAADKRNGVSVLLFQRLQRGIIRRIYHRSTTVRQTRQAAWR